MSRLLKTSMIFMWSCILFACQDKYERIIPPLDVTGVLTQDVPIEGGSYYLTAVCEGEVTVKSDAAWCTAEFVPGAQSNNIKITVQPNEDKKRGCRVSIQAFSQPTVYAQINQAGSQIVVVKPEIVGNWQFTNPDNFGRATTGADLELKGSAFFETAGINGGKAVEVGKGSYFIARHGLPVNGDGTKVNKYTILMDFKLPEATRACFLQTDMNNSNDVDIFLRANMYQIGIGSVYADLSANPIQAKTWYRLVITAELGQSLKYYLNGVEVFSNDGSAGDAQTDSRLAFDPAGVLLFADEDGEDETIHVAQVTIWDQPLEAAAVAALGAAGSTDYITFKGPLTGKWLFEYPDNLGVAETGNDLVLNGSAIFEMEGPSSDNKAVSVGAGSYLLVKHGIAPSGETASGDPASKINEYSLLIDFKVSQIGRYYTFLQTDLANRNDGEIFINSGGAIGISGGYYSGSVVQPETWYRWVVTVRCGEVWKQYLDGVLLNAASSDHDGKMNVDDRFALDPAGTLLFADEDGEDNEINVAGVALWNKVLSEEEVATLGKVGAPVK